MSFSAVSSWPTSSVLLTRMLEVRSPLATRCAASTARADRGV